MKFRKLMIVCSVLLIFLIMGAAYSAEDINGTATDDSILTETQEKSIGNASADFKCDVHGQVDINYEYGYVASVMFTKDYDVKGNITVSVDDEQCFNQPMEKKLVNCDDIYGSEPYDTNFDYVMFIYKDELKKPITYGTHNITIKNVWGGGEKLLINTTLKGIYRFEVEDLDLYYGGDNSTLFIWLPKDADGTLTVNYNGKSKQVDYKNGYAKLELSYKDFNFGKNKISATLKGDSKYPDSSASSYCTVAPSITPDAAYHNSYIINTDEKAYITINMYKNMGGTLKLYNTVKKQEYDEHECCYYDAYYKGEKVLASAKVVNGVGSVAIDKYKAGTYHLLLEYKYKDYKYEAHCYIVVVKNNPKITVSFSSNSIYEGGQVKATIKSPKADTLMGLMVDRENMDYCINLSKGKITKTFSNLKPGTHKIRFYINEGNIKYSKEFKIKVKSKVSLNVKNVAFKKSSKKFTLKATLKIKGKIAKHKKVSFKLNGKVYKAKTNKKGIAKVTLKKSKLGKIKVGKKIKFQVTYGKKTVKKYIKVKK